MPAKYPNPASDGAASIGAPATFADPDDLLRDAITGGAVGVLVVDDEGTVQAVNETFAAWVGRPPDRIVGDPIWCWLGSHTADGWPERWSTLLEAGLLEFESQSPTVAGPPRPTRTLIELQRQPGQAPRAVFRISPKVQRCAGETSVFDWYRCVSEYGEEGYWGWHLATGRISVSRQWCALFGMTLRTQVTLETLRALLGAANFAQLLSDAGRMTRGEVDRSDTLLQVRRLDGRSVWIRHRAYVAARTAEGRVGRIVGRAVDVTDDRMDGNVLRDLVQRVPVAMLVYRANGAVDMWNPALVDLLGCAPGEVPDELSRRRREGWGLVDERGVPVPYEALPSILALTTGQAIRGRVYGLTPRGSQVRRWGVLNALPRCDTSGAVLDVVTTFTDITAHRRLEVAFARASRLESLGRLAGGVAHDFNNLLTSVLGNAELIRMVARDQPEVLEAADEIVDAARRGASLNQQLLGYARRQPMRARPVLLGQRVREAGALVERLLGGRIAVVVPEVPGPSVRCDPHQLEQVVLDLAVNAQAAMDDGGTLTLAVDTVRIGGGHDWPGVEPGSFGRLRMIDDGSGMAPDVRARAFEPFFTTKPDSGGAGLGLATCYGIVRQNDGHIRLLSTPGRGTTVELLLPRTAGPEPELAPMAAGDTPSVVDGAVGAVLLVDGDPTVRRMASRVLAANGHTVWTAADAAETLRLVAGGCRPDLVVTERQVSGSSGSALAALLRVRWPGLRTLFTARGDGSGAGEPAECLRKPYGPSTLSRRVAEILAGPA